MNNPFLQGGFTGLLAAVVYFIIVLLLVGLGSLYGSLFDIASELPVLLTLPFWLSLFAALVSLPVAGVVMAAGRPAKSPPWRPVLAAGFIGLVSALGIFILGGGGGALFDWPGLLFVIQMLLAAFIAAALLPLGRSDPAGAGGVEPVRSRRLKFFGRLLLVWSGVSMLLVAVPFLLLWAGKSAFEDEAAPRAGTVFVLPPAAGFTVRDEGSRSESLGANERYAATYRSQEDGREFAVTVFGDRERFTVVPDEISATLNITDPVLVRRVDWQSLSSGSREPSAELLEMVQPYVNTELELAAVRTDLPSPEVRFRGEGVEVIARPTGSVSAPAGLFCNFRISD